ncbi:MULTISPECIES: DUF6440 family protein [unclassified Psychrobacillus]|uniref:DUF6440 family protein n=1 Tax=unclassified Psychrobacillus TaxID=2636677 RepID=UPI0030F9A88E
MKKRGKIIVGLLAVIILSGCSSDPSESLFSAVIKSDDNVISSNSRFEVAKIDMLTHILTDKETKVQYLQLYRNGGFDGGVDVTPLLNGDGTPYLDDDSDNKNRFTKEEIDSLTYILLDSKTGIEYLINYRNGGYDGGLSVTPLLNQDGKPYQKA